MFGRKKKLRHFHSWELVKEIPRPEVDDELNPTLISKLLMLCSECKERSVAYKYRRRKNWVEDAELEENEFTYFIRGDY